MTISRPVISMIVRTTLSFTLSLTPRKLIAASAAMNNSAMAAIPTLPQSRPKPLIRFDANACDAVDAEVIPEHITTNATMKVKK